MTVPLPEDASWDSRCIQNCRRFGTQLMENRITFEEFAYNVSVMIVSASDACMPQCIELIPCDVLPQYAEYLRAFLEPVDFKPCPLPFHVGPVSEEELESAKQQLRPRYIRLYHLVTEKREKNRMN
jgi:hypothetical protein